MFARVRWTWIVLLLALATQLFAQAQSESKYKDYRLRNPRDTSPDTAEFRAYGWWQTTGKRLPMVMSLIQ
jgi:hypothetical protein